MRKEGKSKLIELFQLYNYVIEKEDYHGCIVFSLNTGIYSVVEIIQWDGTTLETAKEVQKKYYEAGYDAVKISPYTSIEEIENYLFNGFFYVKSSNERISRSYSDYTTKVMSAYEGEGRKNTYNYINVDYSLEVDFQENGNNGKNVIENIKSYMECGGAHLIIVEASAGFGKTSTAYELYNTYAGIEKNTIPLFMELSRDRQAPTFRLLLLSQIERMFGLVLSTKAVIYNIKKGRIPLIIDGFDELLSKDLDSGGTEAKFSEVETMLSTIADLLTENTKVLLTSRKTAIFSGESFYDWYLQIRAKKDTSFQIERFQLHEPCVEDWLPNERLRRLPLTIKDINNPVLLGYLRYLEDKEFDKAISSNLVERYFDSLLRREQERQALPFNVDEQKEIFSRTAVWFASYNIASDKRSDVKSYIYELSSNLIDKRATDGQTAETLANALTNHALMDRKENGNVGFINDFILGNMLCYAIQNEKDQAIIKMFRDIPYPFVEKALVSASTYSKEEKEFLGEMLYDKCELNEALKFWIDVRLRFKSVSNQKDMSFNEGKISCAYFCTDNAVYDNCTFSNMYFEGCFFHIKNIRNCMFIRCQFKDCTFDAEVSEDDFFDCKFENTPHSYSEINMRTNKTEDENNKEATQNEILKMYLQVDGKTQRMRMLSRIREGYNPKSFKRTIKDLLNSKFIVCNGDKSFITELGIKQISL